MEKWQKPQLEELDIMETKQGKNLAVSFDELRVDQNGNYWVSFGSGTDSKPDTDGDIEVN